VVSVVMMNVSVILTDLIDRSLGGKESMLLSLVVDYGLPQMFPIFYYVFFKFKADVIHYFVFVKKLIIISI